MYILIPKVRPSKHLAAWITGSCQNSVFVPENELSHVSSPLNILKPLIYIYIDIYIYLYHLDIRN